jgi:cation diffusion facilitator CzcD-associated flavoprotein CzcO
MAWHVYVERKNNNKLEHWLADVVCQCVGSLDRPKFGTTPDRENYKGVSWHTAYWCHDYDLTDKKVAIIGCGPSAAQIIPRIVDKVEHLTVYMRTPPVCIPRWDYKYSRYVPNVIYLSVSILLEKNPMLTGGIRLFRFAISWIPLFAYLVRQRMNLRMMILGRQMATDHSKENDRMTKLAVDFMESQIQDPELQELVRPYSKCTGIFLLPGSDSSSSQMLTNSRLLQAPSPP